MRHWYKVKAKRPNKKLLAHYTSLYVLEKMCDNKELWGTRIDQLNDSEEFWHGFKMLLAVSKEHIAGILGRQLAFEYHDTLEGLVRNLRASPPSVHVICFSERRDSLNQWRSYAGENGVALIFKYKHLHRISNKSEDNENIWFLPCLYNKRDQRKVTEEVVAEELNVRELTNCRTEEHFIRLANNLIERFCHFAPLFKDKSFKPEAEWRMVIKGVVGSGIPNIDANHPRRFILDPKGKAKAMYRVGLVLKDSTLDRENGINIGLNKVVAGPGKVEKIDVNILLHNKKIKVKHSAKKSQIPLRY